MPPTSPASASSLGARLSREDAWRPLTTVVLGTVAIVALLVLALDGYLLGLAQGLAVAAAGVGVTTILSGGRTTLPAAATAAEDLSRDQLRASARRGDVYGWVDNLVVGGSEIAHLVLTPQGAVAIDATWHSGSKARAEVTGGIAAAGEAASHARKVLQAVGSRVLVTPVAVLWGPGQDGVGDPRVVGDVHVLAGRDLTGWLARRNAAGSGPAVCDELTARALLAELETLKSRARADLQSGTPSTVR